MSERIVATDGHEGHWYTGEEIVRCRDCRYFGRIDSYHWCENDCIYRPQDDDFCSSGERRDA